MPSLVGSEMCIRDRPILYIYRCQRGHRERKRSSVAHVSTVVSRGSKRADLCKTRRSPAPVGHVLGYSTRNGEFKEQEPHFQMCETRSEWRETTEPAVAWTHSRECTKKPTYVLPNNGSTEEFGAWTELWNILQEQLIGRGGTSYRFDCLVLCFCGHCNTGVLSTAVRCYCYYSGVYIIILHCCAVCVRAVLQCRRTCHLLRTST